MAAPVKRLLLLGAGTCRLLERPWASGLASRSLTLAAPAFRSESPWHLFGAVCLQRPPLVSKPLSPLQEEMAALLRQVRSGASAAWPPDVGVSRPRPHSLAGSRSPVALWGRQRPAVRAGGARGRLVRGAVWRSTFLGKG